MTAMSTDLATLPTEWTPSHERRLWKKLVRVAARLTFADTLVAAWYCAVDPLTPTHVRGVLFGALGYFLLPVDAIPDLVAGIGFADDASVLAAVVTTIGRYITSEHRAQARRRLDDLLA
jgi:uncharacterized membrane protein YkvA (DUF1232 family)